MAGREEIEWLKYTISLGDIVPHIPTLMKVTEGIYQTNEAGSFSSGDLIRIDGYKQTKRVQAYALVPGTLALSHDNSVSLPYHYSGKVRVLPMFGEYHEHNSVEDIITHFPRNIRLLSQISFTEPSGTPKSIPTGSVLEVKSFQRSEDRTIEAVRCLWNDETVILPRRLRGMFQVLPDDKVQTVREVVRDYTLPQRVKFLDDDVQKLMTWDIQVAIGNLNSYTGEMMLVGVSRSFPVLFGHYKGMDKDDISNICRRSAVIMPMNVPELRDIQVQIPKYKQSPSYEIFMMKNFSDANSEIVEGALYVDFVKSLHFIPYRNSAPPALPPRGKCGCAPSSLVKTCLNHGHRQHQSPNLGELKSLEKNNNVPCLPPGDITSNSRTRKFPTPIRRPLAKVRPTSIQDKEFTSASPDEQGTYVKIKETSKKAITKLVKKMSNLHTGIAEKLSANKPRELTSSQHMYDYIDPDYCFKQARLLDPEVCPFSELKISELEYLLIECGLPGLAKTCKHEKIDGDLLLSLPDEILKYKPFRMTEFHIQKLKKIMEGWRPST